jgi:hypothetical protein
MTLKLNENERCCGNCRFYQGRECRRYPPQVWADEENLSSCFPTVKATEWCGEYQPKESWILPKGWEVKSMPDGPGGLCEVQDNS